jgi:hypothetical protein
MADAGPGVRNGLCLDCADLHQHAGTGKLASALLGYGTLALAVWMVFYILKRIFVPLLTGSNFFGSGEYYLGMFSGMIRFACMLLAALALLNAPYYTRRKSRPTRPMCKRWFGGGKDTAAIFSHVPPCRSGLQKILHRALHQELPRHAAD